MGVIPVAETIFAPVTLMIVLALAIVIPITVVLMRPRSDVERVDLPEEVLEEEEELTKNRTASEAPAYTETPASSRVQRPGGLAPERARDAKRG